MNITYTYRNLDSSDAIEATLKKHLDKIKKFINGSSDVHCIMTVEGYRNEVELVLTGSGFDCSAHDSSDDMYKAATNAALRLEKQVHKQKEKVRSH